MQTQLRGYARDISEATEVTDPATLAEIEDFMRDEHRTLDGISRAEFVRCARECWRTVAYLRTPLGQAEWNRELRLAGGATC